MPRFKPEKWKPRNESSPGVWDLDPDSVVLLIDTRLSDDSKTFVKSCPCGCGEYPASEKTTFCMGHDARLRGKLIRAHLMNTPVREYVTDEGLHPPTDAYDVAQRHEWGKYLDGAELRREGKNRELLQRALNHPDMLKTARWDYTGGQVVVIMKPNPKTGMSDVMYVNQAGEIRKGRVPAPQEEKV